ncbi:aminoglycoside phosphotransferase family protein [Couchioplanes caeruleus]|uniref:Aminoglycoside phosphotransferase n=2 Tax=Couchioplanes caeruleus TaxID=56438 RepID=A0A1K0GRW5_9ACTN|nr:aminoglycoside phosphotransferase family protein [Couchioplanes caeruleus]OJF15174.1 aminoglycoside phosphotransferase [Couchioplanes caeruleus subsp. caeruleus]ROP33640.1 aminoglycoside phosphotransferase (APT) family kinase protein [Couchioplanes caeruleus]
MSEIPDLGPPPQRITVDAEQVRRLISGQFPEPADLPIEPVANGGWDNWTFHLGPNRLVRLPSAAEYALAVDKEHRWLPALAAQLPLPVPAPLAKGKPGAGYPYPWSIYRWLDGEPARVDRIADPVRFALDLAEFLAALQSIDSAGGPQPGIHNWFRGGTLRTYDKKVYDALAELAGHVDAELIREIWARALDARWDGVDRWFHGDIAQGNLLLADGQLAAVIDFGTCGVGDPACDLAIAWTLLTADGRQAFCKRLTVDDATWARGRGWALWKTLASCPDTFEDPEDAKEFANAQRILGEIFSEYTASAVTKPNP